MGTTHAIVIGTGAGGLAAAGYLAKNGFDVLALEQAEQIGGYLSPFVREGYKFDLGVHYLGQGRPGQPLYQLLAGVGVDPQALLNELDPEGFDVYRFPDFEIRNCRGLDRFCDRLIERFPKEEHGLRRFFKLVESSAEVNRALHHAAVRHLHLEDLRALPKVPSVLRWAHRTYADVLRAYVTDPRARAVLAATSGDYGLPPSRAAAQVGLGVLAYYGDGGFYPNGGGGGLRDALAAAAEKHGARFRTAVRVEKILTRDSRVVGVSLASGERIEADVVISNADPTLTFGRLLDPSTLPRELRERMRCTEPSIASFGVYLGMKRDLRAYGLGRVSVWDYADWDVERAYDEVLSGRLPGRAMFFLSPSSLKDASGTLAPPGCSTLEIVTLVPYSMFERWKDLPPAQRGADYEAEKRRVTESLLESVEKRWPGLVGDVVVRESSTPLTNETYTMAVRGGAYGLAHTPEQMGRGRFGTKTPLPNLFLAGSGVFSCGVASCLASGRAAAAMAARAVARRRAGAAA
ncbi:MAG TPA: NAD(P)/FAD-dependent oxidoreductase [Polyangiaceae bacterium]|nr:NAD(P)/FAD-dependent oxidoreductase [Polyangiaceae bacterium]